MLNTNNILNKKQFARGLEIVEREGQYSYHTALLSFDGNEVSIEEQQTHISSLEELDNIIKNKEIPLLISINTSQILYKKGLFNINNKEQIIAQILPSANSDLFLMEAFPYQDEKLYALIRKSLVLETIEQLASKGFWVTGIGLGPFNIQEIQSFIAIEEVHTQGFLLNYHDNKLNHFNKNDNHINIKLQIENEEVESFALPSIAMAFKGLMNPNEVYLGLDILKENQGELKQKKQFKHLMAIGISSLLFLLIISTLYSFRLEQKNQLLQSILIEKSEQVILFDSLDNQLVQLKEQGAAAPSKTSFYADQIANALPENALRLTQIHIHPLKGKERDYMEGDFLMFQDKNIIVSGFSQSALAYNVFQDNLNQLDWIEQIKHLEYEENEDGIGDFKLEIKIKE